jgi:hypothetical protein
LADVVPAAFLKFHSFHQVEQSSYNLSIARAFAAGAYTRGKVFVAGGMTAYAIDDAGGNATATFTTRVDIFDLATGQHNTTELPGPARGTHLSFFAFLFVVLPILIVFLIKDTLRRWPPKTTSFSRLA